MKLHTQSGGSDCLKALLLYTNTPCSLPVCDDDRKCGKVNFYMARTASEQNIAVVGLGENEPAEKIRRAAAALVKAARDRKLYNVAISAEGICADTLVALLEGCYLGEYMFDQYKSEKKQEINMYIDFTGSDIAEADRAAIIKAAETRAAAVCFTRDLANTPGEDMYPYDFAAKMEQTFADTGVSVTVFKDEQMSEFVGTSAVGRGSVHPPAFVTLRYCSDSTKPLSALVGKGLCFDMGGLSLKLGRDNSDMKFDMCGGAAVAGVFHLLAHAQPDGINAIGIIPLAVNLPDGNALLPSTILRYPNGTTVEIANTDAEGRLLLADALLYAKKQNAAEIINICTLTGGIGAALGDKLAGIFGQGDIVDKLIKIGDCNGDKLWHMPLAEEYADSLKGKYADLCNIADGSSSITAALFLQKFVDKDMPWAHLDIAGTAYTSSPYGYYGVGAKGIGVRLMYDYITRAK